jgi:hypothetical protein
LPETFNGLRPQVIWDTALEAAGINMPILAPL